MSKSAKNELLELLKDLGCSEDTANFQSESVSPSGSHYSTVLVVFPDGRQVQGSGEGKRKSDADIAAAQVAIEHLSKNYPDLMVDWDEINAKAQAGDALIKLGVYLSKDLKSTRNKSEQLQRLEADKHLAEVFDQWKFQGDPALAKWGNELGEKRKATLVEALIWERFGMQIIAVDASTKLNSLLNILAL